MNKRRKDLKKEKRIKEETVSSSYVSLGFLNPVQNQYTTFCSGDNGGLVKIHH